MLTFLAFSMVIVFMTLIMTKRLSPLIALILILHSGGLGTVLSDVRAVRGSALALSTAELMRVTLGGVRR